MKLKRPLNFGRWEFFVEQDSGEEYRIPAAGFAKSSRGLSILVDAYFNSQAMQGKPEYLDSAKKEARALHIEYWDYLTNLIEHQICLRNGGSGGKLCNSSGLGDDLHSLAEGVDSIIEKSPKIVKKVVATALRSTLLRGKKISNNVQPRLSGCSACGGSKSYNKQGNNLGRAGRLNKQ